jgi:hypothetical protein
MADFSKQWCDKNDPQMPSNFDIEEIANTLEPNHYTPIICEGFGFIAIGKDTDSNIMLAMPTGHFEEDENGQIYDDIVWEPYNNIIK